MIQLTFSLSKLGFAVFARTFWKYKEFYIIPGVVVSFANLESRRKLDIEIKILCFGIGFQLYLKKY